MSRYLKVAEEGRKFVRDLMAITTDSQQPVVAELVARIVNMAIRSCPRGVQHTVRLNIVRKMLEDAPVRVSMEERKDEKTGRKFYVLITQAILPSGNLAPASETIEVVDDAE